MLVNQERTDLRGFTSELKFVVDAEVAERIRDWARQRLEPDPHGNGAWSDRYVVSSVYFDNETRDVFFRRGSYGRSKYRIRRYEDAATVFLERKLRTGSRLAKRRTSIDATTLPLIAGSTLNAGPPPRVFGAVGCNGDATAWFRRRVALRRLAPVCQVSYTRIARMSQTAGGPVRLTLDEALNACQTQSFAFETIPGTPILQGSAIVELKYRGSIPAIFKEAVETFTLTPQRWSKYRAAATALCLVPPARDERPPAHA